MKRKDPWKYPALLKREDVLPDVTEDELYRAKQMLEDDRTLTETDVVDELLRLRKMGRKNPQLGGSVSIRKKDGAGDYCVVHKYGGKEATYFTPDLSDANGTALDMMKRYGASDARAAWTKTRKNPRGKIPQGRLVKAIMQMYKKPLKDRHISEGDYDALYRQGYIFREPTSTRDKWYLTGSGLGVARYHSTKRNPYMSFKKLSKKVKSKALAAWIGRKKYGKKRFAKMSAAGRRAKRNCPCPFKNPQSKRDKRYVARMRRWRKADPSMRRLMARTWRKRVRRNFSHKHWGKLNTFLGIAASAFVVYHYINKYRTKGIV